VFHAIEILTLFFLTLYLKEKIPSIVLLFFYVFIKYDKDDELAADRLKNAAATKKLCIMDAFEILKKIQEEKDELDGVETKDNKTIKGFAESNSK